MPVTKAVGVMQRRRHLRAVDVILAVATLPEAPRQPVSQQFPKPGHEGPVKDHVDPGVDDLQEAPQGGQHVPVHVTVTGVGQFEQRDHLGDDAERVRHEAAQRHAEHRQGQATEPDVRRVPRSVLVLVQLVRLPELPARRTDEVDAEEQK